MRQVTQCLVVAGLVEVRGTTFAVIERVRRIESDRVRKVVDRVAEAIEVKVRIAASIERVGVRWIESDRVREVLDRIVEATEVVVGVAAILPCVRVVRIERDDDREVGDRIVVPIHGAVQEPTSSNGLDVAWIQRDGTREIGHRLGIATESLIRGGSNVVHEGAGRFELQRLGEVRDGVRIIAHRCQRLGGREVLIGRHVADRRATLDG